MTKTRFYLYNNTSKGGCALAETMGIMKIKHSGSTFYGGPDWTIINWGAGHKLPASVLRSKIINKPDAICLAVNKLDFFRKVGDKARTVPWTTDPAIAKSWDKVVCRKRLEGKEGEGITIWHRNAQDGSGSSSSAPATSPLGWWQMLTGDAPSHSQPLPSAKLYTKFIPSIHEYRVHVVGDKAVAVHRKVGGTSGDVKNTDNGWTFKKVTIFNPDITAQAIKAVQAIGLDFGAADVLWTGENKAYVMEVNTAPGIDGMTATLSAYSKALLSLVKGEGG